MDQDCSWRWTKQDPFTGERKGFAGLSELVAYLEAQVRDANDDGDEMPGGRK